MLHSMKSIFLFLTLLCPYLINTISFLIPHMCYFSLRVGLSKLYPLEMVPLITPLFTYMPSGLDNDNTLKLNVNVPMFVSTPALAPVYAILFVPAL